MSGRSIDETLCAPGFTCRNVATDVFECEALCTTGGAFGPPCVAGAGCTALVDPSRFLGATVGACAP